jgi:DNA-binding transcriptional LysR family regulator
MPSTLIIAQQSAIEAAVAKGRSPGQNAGAPLDLNHVTAFVRVVQDGSFTAAARALGLPKSSVSRSVAQLEHDLGVRLLHRTTRKLHLTDAGTAFHDRVARALADIDEATTATSDLQRDLRGTIRISAPFDLGVWAVAGIVTRFVKRNAGVSI